MVPEKLAGRVNPIPYNEKMGPSPMTKQPLPQPESTKELMNNAASVARHPMGRGIPPDHEVFQ
jgi:hypothetical protein